ncbi:hypothetical protein AGMMS4952_02160 [Spirochaetia bacterium]|nr:hypothetical protein AGMMS4952_02160 [Spirochaetia bacterium]
MVGMIENLNNWLKHWSGIAGAIAALIIAVGIIYAFTGKLKRLFFGDIYKTLYKIENNELKHIDISLQQVRKTEDLTLDILLGIVSKEDAINKRYEIERWYTKELETLLKQPEEKKPGK